MSDSRFSLSNSSKGSRGNAFSTATRVIYVPEHLASVLVHLPYLDLLHCRSTSRFWKECIDGTPVLQQCLWKAPLPPIRGVNPHFEKIPSAPPPSTPFFASSKKKYASFSGNRNCLTLRLSAIGHRTNFETRRETIHDILTLATLLHRIYCTPHMLNDLAINPPITSLVAPSPWTPFAVSNNHGVRVHEALSTVLHIFHDYFEERNKFWIQGMDEDLLMKYGTEAWRALYDVYPGKAAWEDEDANEEPDVFRAYLDPLDEINMMFEGRWGGRGLRY
ncbi:hypothetical protein BU23DRAFT_601376 [Bimuria novae-zelandiae CBS 107.79]|uniref:F-box domain-containing protein n=1 Tax=Bimuria novae-zelandiae CBS 107.79 TaxID=1447943 RepID=A0A6A5UY81_9PLEO|nr:hypothetical protein BU23DRAFT_601376 [Bimuria novae-zelandiae CBS 107.79]